MNRRKRAILCIILCIVGLLIYHKYKVPKSYMHGRMYFISDDKLIKYDVKSKSRYTIMPMQVRYYGNIICQSFGVSPKCGTVAYVGRKLDGGLSDSILDINIFDMVNNKILQKYPMETDNPETVGLSLSPDGRYLAVGYMAGVSNAGCIDIIDLHKKRKTASFYCGGLFINAPSWHPDSNKLAYIGKYGNVCIYDVSKKTIKSYKLQGEPIYSPNGDFIYVSVGEEVILEVSTGRITQLNLPSDGYGVGWTPDGNGIMYNVSPEIHLPKTRIYDIKTGKSYLIPVKGGYENGGSIYWFD